MDDEEPLINWEEEAITYQKALEAALEYQRRLEETIAQQENKFQELLSDYMDLSDKAQEMVLESYANSLEETIEQLKAKIAEQDKTIDRFRTNFFEEMRERKILKNENMDLKAQIKAMKKKHREEAKKQKETTKV
jgi:flagellar biosynthesis chaperone FliJ